jgi:hypothetical protein
MAVEKFIAIASLGLFVMFSGEMVTMYHFMSQPQDTKTPIIEPEPKILQFISIGVAPALILTGVSFILIKRHGSKQIGTMIIAGGVILLVGMAYSYTLVDDINKNYLILVVQLAPLLFMAVSIPVIIIGISLFKIKKPKQKKDYV